MKTIVVGVPTVIDAEDVFKRCLSEFRKKGLFIQRASLNQTSIDTSSCRVIFVPEKYEHKRRGIKSDACFGFPEEIQCLMNWTRKPTDYKGTFLDYVYEVEDIKE